MDNYKVDVFTGIRPSGGLTIANVIGSVHSIVKLQNEDEIGRPLVFVADLHGLTDKEPKETQNHVLDIVKDYITLGLDIKKNDIFVQSQITPLIAELNLYLSRLVSISELLRIPTLKDKMKSGQSETSVNALLAMYPVMMASDILIQRAKYIPVGDDQVAHVEFARMVARKFNKRYTEIFPIPKVLSLGEPLRIISLNGKGKMSKTEPTGAILIDDPIEISLNKIKKAQSAFAGETSDTLDTIVTIGKFVGNEQEIKQIGEIMERHFKGENVMGQLKEVVMVGLERYLKDFQSKKAKLTDEYVLEVIENGKKVALKNATETINDVRKAMSLEYV
jgi:tryptophanyl-tRNA synthetase